METKKFLVIGAEQSVTTTVMENICEKLFQRGTLELGSLILNRRKISLFNFRYPEKSGLMRYSFVYKIDGAVIFIDHNKGLTQTDRELITILNEKNIPYVILAYKNWDLEDDDEKTNQINTPIIPIVAKDRESLLKGLEDPVGINLTLPRICQNPPLCRSG